MCSVCMDHVSCMILTCLRVHPPLGIVCTCDVLPAGEAPLREWGKLGKWQKVIQHSPGDGSYGGVAVNSVGLLAVTDDGNMCIRIFRRVHWWGPLGKECLVVICVELRLI